MILHIIVYVYINKERSPREGNGNVLQYFCLGNSMDRGAWQAAVHGVTKESDMTEWLNNNKIRSRWAQEYQAQFDFSLCSVLLDSHLVFLCFHSDSKTECFPTGQAFGDVCWFLNCLLYPLGPLSNLSWNAFTWPVPNVSLMSVTGYIFALRSSPMVSNIKQHSYPAI